MNFFKPKLILFASILTLFSVLNAYAEPVAGTPTGPPLPVTGISSSEGANPTILSVSWSALTSDLETGGSPITGYAATLVTNSSNTNSSPAPIVDAPSAWTVVTSTACTVGGSTLTCTLTGLNYATWYSIRMTASNAIGTSKPSYSTPFKSGSNSNVISFTQPSAHIYGDPDFQLNATSDSGLTIGWAATGVCTIDAGGVVHLTGVGNCTVTASDAGGNGFAPATSVPRTFAVTSNFSATATGSSTITGTSANLRGNVPYPGATVNPRFCISTVNSTATCSISANSSPTAITSTSGASITGSVTGLNPGTTYYFWVEAGTAQSNILEFTTLSVPVITYPLTSTGKVGTSYTGTASIAGGSGVYGVTTATGLPDGLTFNAEVSGGTISGTPTIAATFSAVTFSVTDSSGQTATKVVTITIAAADPAPVTPTPTPTPSPTPTPTPTNSKLSQTISSLDPVEPYYSNSPNFNLNASTTSGLPLTYFSSNPNVCTVSSTGVISYVGFGVCTITINQPGNSTYNPASKIISFTVVQKYSIILNEVTNIQSGGATLNATAPWPGKDGEVTFCVSVTSTFTPCNSVKGIDLGLLQAQKLTDTSGSEFSADLEGLEGGKDYFVWAQLEINGETIFSQMRKIHTPIGPTITYSGKLVATKAEPLRILFRASGGAGGYKNWKAIGFPTGTNLAPSTTTLIATGSKLKSGTYIVTVSVSDKLGSTTSITIPVEVIGEAVAGAPSTVQGATTQLISSNSIQVKWKSQPDAQKYEVSLASKIVCSTIESSCVIKQLLGPKAQLTVTAVNSSGLKSQPAATIYKAPSSPIDVAVGNFALNSSVLTAIDKATFAKFAKVMQAQGFTSIQVSGHTDSQGNDKLNSALSRARALNTFNYLKQILAKTPISVTLIAEGAGKPVESNATAEGRAANRRSVVAIN